MKAEILPGDIVRLCTQDVGDKVVLFGLAEMVRDVAGLDSVLETGDRLRIVEHPVLEEPAWSLCVCVGQLPKHLKCPKVKEVQEAKAPLAKDV